MISKRKMPENRKKLVILVQERKQNTHNKMKITMSISFFYFLLVFIFWKHSPKYSTILNNREYFKMSISF